MKSIVFRPLRRVKKSGKIVVAAYSQWRKVQTADYSQFVLAIDREYAGLPDDEYVYNHEGVPLFWKDINPDSIPVFEHSPAAPISIKEVRAVHKNYAIKWFIDGRIHYSCSQLGLDCDGVPAFSHYTIGHVADRRSDFAEWEPLTVGIVKKWYAWWLCQLQNANLQVGR